MKPDNDRYNIININKKLNTFTATSLSIHEEKFNYIKHNNAY